METMPIFMIIQRQDSQMVVIMVDSKVATVDKDFRVRI